jgi:acyl-CoA synthetase (AMP-forming)/AMP-acid ligase II
MIQTNTRALETVLARISSHGDKPALFWQGKEFTYADFLQMIDTWVAKLGQDGVGSGSVVGYKGDYSPQTCALMFALMKVGAILVPFTSEVSAEMSSFMKIAGVEFLYDFNEKDVHTLSKFPKNDTPYLVAIFLERKRPGLIVFTSGSTGKPKGILHDCEMVMRKFEKPRRAWRTILFLLMDHFGGFNTFLATFANGGVGICPESRSANAVAKAISDAQASLLPATPTFLNLMIANQVYRSHDITSVQLITYGTELMSATTLQKCLEIFPNAQFKQTYGLSELGVLRSDSQSKESVWVKIGGPGFEVKLVDGVLWVRSESNMVGYLNAPSPFDSEGWMCTGDQVDTKDGFVRFLGRKSELIKVGGKKVYPIEVENVLMEAANINSATVFGKPHPIMGQVVHAQISLDEPEESAAVTERLRAYCNERLAQFKVPIRFTIVDEADHHNSRFKKVRREKDATQTT